jgi:hypothetical protein
MWAALRAESSSMISGHAQFAITAEIVAQFEKEVKQNIQDRESSAPARQLPISKPHSIVSSHLT